MKRILVCLDGSKYAQPCCEYAAWLAKKTGAQLELVYVSNIWDFEMPFLMDLGSSFGATPYQGVTAQLEEIENTKAQLIEEAARKVFERVGLQQTITFNHQTGLLVDCLHEFEESDKEVDLILIGKRGEGASGATDHLGGTMERVVRASGKPCLVVNRDYRELKKAVLAYDNGEICQKALRWICNEERVTDVDLHIISVGQAHGEGTAAESIKAAKAICQEHGKEAHFQLISGDAEDEIADYIDTENADLLIMGAYGHSRIRELLIGSTTTDLLRRCHVPLLLFR